MSSPFLNVLKVTLIANSLFKVSLSLMYFLKCMNISYAFSIVFNLLIILLNEAIFISIQIPNFHLVRL